MFLLTNLATGGIGGPGPYGMDLWLTDGAEGVVGLTRSGMLLPQWPQAADWTGMRALLSDRDLTGALGPPAQVRPLIAALGLQDAPCLLDADEQGFALDLGALHLPPGPDLLTPMQAAPPGLAADWRTAYRIEVMGDPPDRAARLARDEADRMQQAGNHRLLWQDGQPVALCGFNAVLPDVVQVGGVYVPPGLRRRGLARRAVALHLAEARAQGVARAVLFAVSEMAARAYRAIGFQAAESMALVLFDGPQRVAPWG